ncbi:probable G-protein coupled receptor 83 isoform X2 [Actinia tenebrosa]|uniref:Probable G-protein coupled receptor 83 isoform X2 n=1 Tax=Actinia tenebrosa TaxID=6105 RepID=A0A6P8J4H5_ACTTE|nr:probable G-protein coupled receptor 83 isoform X2 [Actinia tenebrosa]
MTRHSPTAMDRANSTFPTGPDLNSSSQRCSVIPDDTDAEIIIKIFSLSVILFLSTFGNILVIGVVHKNKSMRHKSINLYIVNLATSDLLLALVFIPGTICELLNGQGTWLITGFIGEATCRLVYFIQDVSIAVSVQSLVVIAFDRFCAVVYPLRITTTSSTIRLIVIPMTWLVACAIHASYFFTYKLQWNPQDNTTMCRHIWSTDKNEHDDIMLKHYLAMFCLFFAIPVLLLVILYSLIFAKLRLRSQKMSLRTSGTIERRREQEWNVLKMAFAIVLAFFMCYGPLNVVVFFIIFKWGTIGDACNIKTILFITTFLFLFNTALNPFIYFIFSENFRLGFVRMFVRTSKHGSGKCFLKSIKKIRTTDYESGHRTVYNVIDTAV